MLLSFLAQLRLKLAFAFVMVSIKLTSAANFEVTLSCDVCPQASVVSLESINATSNVEELARLSYDSAASAYRLRNFTINGFLATVKVDTLYRVPIYIAPGGKYFIHITHNKVIVAGTQSALNEYLQEYRHIGDSLEVKSNSSRVEFRKFTLAQQNDVRNDIDSAFMKINSRVRDDRRLSSKEKATLLKDNRDFRRYLKDSFIDWFAESIYLDWKAKAAASNAYAPYFFAKLRVDIEFSNSGFYSYLALVDQEILFRLWKPIQNHFDELGIPYDDGAIAKKAIDAINSKKYPLKFEELLVAKCLLLALRKGEITNEIEQLISNYKTKYPNALHIDRIMKEFVRSDKLRPGLPAIDFEGIGTDGRNFRLAQLKGKIVYVDLWATWCGPCIAEFTNSKKLIGKYKEANDIVFLFVSVDSDKKKWLNFLSKNRDLSGLHMNIQKSRDFSETYRLQGIPHYILIDRQGNFVSSNAPRPSDPEIVSLLDTLLSNGTDK